jgi:hypothetical protein
MSDMSLERGTLAPPAPIVSPRELMPYAVFIGVLGFVLVYFVGSEQGMLSVFSGTNIHEFVHDARHLLGFPCH